MFKLLISAILICCSGIVFAQNDVTLRINHMINGNSLMLGKTIGTNKTGETYRTDRLQYFISELIIQHDGGKAASFPKLYLLVNANNPLYTIGSGDINAIEKISFKIGVDSVANHSDPTAYPSGHPLSLSSPSMHWGWAAGYRFLALEGVCTMNGTEDLYQFHTIGDELYTSITINNPSQTKAGKSIEIQLDAEYNHLVDDLKLQGGLIQHGNLPPNPSIMKHFVDVFGAESVSTTDPTNTPEVKITLTNNELLISSSESIKSINVFNMAGIPILTKEYGTGVQVGVVSTSEYVSGVYALKINYYSGRSNTRSIALVK